MSFRQERGPKIPARGISKRLRLSTEANRLRPSAPRPVARRNSIATTAVAGHQFQCKRIMVRVNAAELPRALIGVELGKHVIAELSHLLTAFSVGMVQRIDSAAVAGDRFLDLSAGMLDARKQCLLGEADCGAERRRKRDQIVGPGTGRGAALPIDASGNDDLVGDADRHLLLHPVEYAKDPLVIRLRQGRWSPDNHCRCSENERGDPTSMPPRAAARVRSLAPDPFHNPTIPSPSTHGIL